MMRRRNERDLHYMGAKSARLVCGGRRDLEVKLYRDLIYGWILIATFVCDVCVVYARRMHERRFKVFLVNSYLYEHFII